MIEVLFRADCTLDRCGFREGHKALLPLSEARRFQAAGLAHFTDPGLAAQNEPRIGAMLRIRNEAAWIDEVLTSLVPVCAAGIVIMDDSSDDGTVELLHQFRERLFGDNRIFGIPRVHILPSPFPKSEGIDEARDKTWLVRHTMALLEPDWILCVDGDEVLMEDSKASILGCIQHGSRLAYSLKVEYLWDSADLVRIDGIYGRFYRPSLFFTRATPLEFRATGNGGNFHCSNVPSALLPQHGRCLGRLKHYGYLHAAQRIAKYGWYNQIDPGNQGEDCYRHIVQGDIDAVPAEAVLKHAGPLRLERLG